MDNRTYICDIKPNDFRYPVKGNYKMVGAGDESMAGFLP
jgi:hypothetical protein